MRGVDELARSVPVPLSDWQMQLRLMRLFRRVPQTQVSLAWLKVGGWLGAHLTGSVPHAPRKRHIEAVAVATDQLGPQRLADEYGEPGGERTPAVVRSSSAAGDVYAWLAQQRRPATIVEFGTAFGVSGMYFAAGLEAAGSGHLYSFEINREWADIAERNVRSVSNRFTLTRGSFEGCVTDVLTRANRHRVRGRHPPVRLRHAAVRHPRAAHVARRGHPL